MSYLLQAAERLERLDRDTGEQLNSISREIAHRLKNKGVIHVFGCGHSGLIAQEPYYRAGGLVPVRPILVEPLMLHKGAVKSSQYEKQPGFIQSYLEKEDIREGDVFLVISTSGRNPAPIDAAIYAREKGAYVIGMLSMDYADNFPSRHPSGKRLEEVVEEVVDTQIRAGDTSQEAEGVSQAFAPMSSVIGTALLQSLLAQVILSYRDLGETPPIFLSGNLEGVQEHNSELVETYKDRISF
ncbi:SIS domain-containing protein [Halobacillus halophilus]|uniref:SIS domain-containing protein n=1 Tax=Halobacillus halophilus (strain ATCC 35676 / DSM 2266 / JCM 20832 / KCTC 3685 / LMG 17431 / NBRC 102448 / NCIMB 2269) TaxID=866895 RepID=I0JIX1_HALH3|nr:SIS domain-containing protein [Halobacillus halophilus]ASF38258.1 SIS domain-containing protein [Halobacillus halophilus]CCG44089.1 hypothetical protein HBHAL_1723 [Halobacillus halophilus DSM 2266]